MTAWSEFAEGLTETLATLPAGAVVVIAEPGPLSEPVRFAQFCWYDKGIHAELSGGPLARVSTDKTRIIADAGWRSPGPDDDENWWTRLPWPAPSGDYRRLASMIVTALRDAFGIANPCDLEYRAWNENFGNAPIELYLLGIPCNADN